MASSQKKGARYETFISQLLKGVTALGRDIRDQNAGRNNTVKGKSGCLHQIDVSFVDYSFEAPTLVLIECKNTPSKPVEKVQVAAFKAIIDDIRSLEIPRDVIGIVAYADKARSGALTFAAHYNIQMEKTGIKPNFAFKYQKFIQVGVGITGSASVTAEATVDSSRRSG